MRSFIISISDQMIVSGGQFSISVLIGKHYGVDAFAQYGILLAVWLFSDMLSRALIETPMQSLFATYAIEERNFYLAHLSRIKMVVMLLFFLLIGGVVWCSAVILPHLKISSLALEAALFSAARLLHEWMRKIAYLRGNYRHVLIGDMFIYSTVIALLLLMWSNIIIISLNAFLLIHSAIIYVVCSLSLSQFINTSLHEVGDILSKHWHIGKWLLFSGVGQWCGGQLLLLIAASALSLEDAAGIRAVITILGPIGVIFLAMDNILPVRTAALLNEQGMRAMLHYLARMAFWTTILAALTLGGIASQANVILTALFSSQFAIYASLLQAMCIVSIFSPLSLIVVLALRSLHETKILCTSAIVTGALSILLGGHMLQQYGGIGYAYATCMFMVTTIFIHSIKLLSLVRRHYATTR